MEIVQIFCIIHNPPFLSMMVCDYYEVKQDKQWLVHIYDSLKKEHDFWMQNRGSDIGLNRYDWKPMPKEMLKNE